jgi:signal peptidase I
MTAKTQKAERKAKSAEAKGKTAEKADKNQAKPVEAKGKSNLREYVEAIALAVVLAFFIRTFAVQAFKIPSGSMLPTLQIGDHILVLKFIYGIRNPFNNEVLIPISEPERGDVIVFIYPQDPSKDFIKRVAAVEGDTIEIKEKQLYINGKRAPDEYGHYDRSMNPTLLSDPSRNFGPVTVPEDKVFVMGDNRDHSYDSRYWGFVDLGALRGKAFMIYWSWDSDDWRVRWGRLADLIE